MSGPARRFDPSELRGTGETEPSAAELADSLSVARELEALSGGPGIQPTEGFEDRVMAVIATEPAPRFVIRPGSAVRGGRAGALLIAIRESWGLATTGGRPVAVRAQALAFLLLVVVAFGALAGVGAVTVGGLLGRGPAPSPTIDQGPTTGPTPGMPTGSPSPSGVPGPSASAGPTGTAEPTETAKPGETARPAATPGSTATVKPAETAKAGETPRPTRTPRPTETPKPGETPRPTDTPRSTDDHGGGGGPGPG